MANVKHTTVAVGSNNPDKQISVDAWNDDHEITGTPGALLGFDGSGVATDITEQSLGIHKSVADRAALAALSTDVTTAFLKEANRSGNFVFDSSDLSALVAADPAQGIYVPPASDTTGASGAWVRKFDGALNVQWFGAVADWDGTSGTDNGEAFTAALHYLNATSFPGVYDNGSEGLFIPKGRYWLNTTTLDVHTTIIITGEGVGEAGGNATQLKWSAGATGIRVQESRTTGSTGTVPQDNTQGGDASIIRNLYLEGGYNGSNDADFHGVQLRARASLRDLYITNFQGNGIHIVADTAGSGAPVGNVNNFEVTKAIITGCRNGIYTLGGDVNAGVVTAVDVMYNRQWGISENGFLGNTYVACHAATNTSGPYTTTNFNGQNVFIGCYSESDQPASSFSKPTMVFGGLHAAGVVGTGSYLRNLDGVMTVDSFGAESGSINNLAVNVAAAFQVGASLSFYSGFNGGNALAVGLTQNFGGTIRPGIKSFNTGGGFQPLSIQASDLQVVLGDGFPHLTLDATGMTVTGGPISLDNGIKILTGVSAPEGAITAPPGSLYLQTGGSGTLYVKATGTGNTGWVAK